MPVGTIKNELRQLQIDLQKCITACNALIQKLNGVTDGTSNTVTPFVSTLRREIEKLNNLLHKVYIHCSKELHIFFREYNHALANLLKSNKTIKNYLKDLEDVAKSLYQLFVFDCSIEGFLEYELSSADLRKFNEFIVPYKNELTRIQFETQKRNQELKQKAR